MHAPEVDAGTARVEEVGCAQRALYLRRPVAAAQVHRHRLLLLPEKRLACRTRTSPLTPVHIWLARQTGMCVTRQPHLLICQRGASPFQNTAITTLDRDGLTMQPRMALRKAGPFPNTQGAPDE